MNKIASLQWLAESVVSPASDAADTHVNRDGRSFDYPALVRVSQILDDDNEVVIWKGSYEEWRKALFDATVRLATPK